MQHEGALGQLEMKRVQILDLMDETGAGSAHKLPAFQAGPFIQRCFFCPVPTSGRNKEAPRSHFLHLSAEGELVLTARCKFPFNGRNCFQ